MAGGILQTVRVYLEWAESLAEEYGRSRFSLFLKLFVFRALWGLGPPWFDAYGIQSAGLLSYKDYLSLEECEASLEAFAPVRFRHLEESKTTFAATCTERGIPSVGVEAFISFPNTTVPSGASTVLGSSKELEGFFERSPDMDAIVKPDGGGQGYGLYKVRVRGGKLLPTRDYQSCQDFLDFLAVGYPTDGGFILQRRLIPNEGMADLFPGPGLGTIRVNSFLMADRSVAVPWTFLKIPGPDSLHDNWRMGTGGGLLCPVDVASGRTLHAVGREDSIGPLKEYDHHPVTEVAIAGRQLPQWDKMKTLIPVIAARFPELPALGWDIVITASGPVVLEANWAWTIAAQQILYRRGLRSQLADLLDRLASPCPYAPTDRISSGGR